jgi:hypothetical protein
MGLKWGDGAEVRGMGLKWGDGAELRKISRVSGGQSDKARAVCPD